MTQLRRGDLVTASLLGDYGKPRLAQVMMDKISILPRAKLSAPFGRLDDERMKAVDRALLLVVGVI